MKKIFLDTNLTGLHRDTTIISIGLVTEKDETFYAELNDYDKAQINEWTKENIIHKLLYSPPLKGEDECWSWDNNNKVRMRGNKQEVERYLADWLQALLGGPQSWIDYQDSCKPKEVTKQSIEVWGYCLCYDWVLFIDLWGSLGLTIPRCLYPFPFDIATCLKTNSNREEYLGLYERAKKQNAFTAARAIQKCYDNLKNEKQRLEMEELGLQKGTPQGKPRSNTK